MMRFIAVFTMCAAGAAAAFGHARAQGVEVSVFGGVNFMEERIDDTVVDLDLTGFGPVFAGARIENDLDAGVTVGGAVGWRWDPDDIPFLSVIVEGEVAYRTVDDAVLPELLVVSGQPLAFPDDEPFRIVTIGPNVRAKFTLPLGWFAYGGGGLGAAIQDLSGQEDASVYGQAILGAGFQLFKTVEIGFEYRAFGTQREVVLSGAPVVLDVDTVSNELLGRVSLSF